MIKAYAGVAKTTTLVMLSRELPLLPTLALAFNKSMSDELKSRMPHHIDVFTLNALGHRAWRRKLGNNIDIILETDKIRRLAQETIRAFYPSKKASSKGLAAPGSSAADMQDTAGSLASRENSIPRGYRDVSPSERDVLLKLIVAAGKCRLIPSFFFTAGNIPDHPSSWAKLATNSSLPAPGADQIHHAQQMLIDLVAVPPRAPETLPPENDLLADVVSLAKEARTRGLVPSYFAAHAGLVPDTEAAWLDLALRRGIEDPASWKLALARKVLVQSILAAHRGNVDFDDQIYCSALLGGRFRSYQVGLCARWRCMRRPMPRLPVIPGS
jgi:hypothetical protein